MRDIDLVFAALDKIAVLGASERTYLQRKGIAAVLQHARDFVDKRLAPAQPANDGKQTPFRGHPVFIAQHATADSLSPPLGPSANAALATRAPSATGRGDSGGSSLRRPSHP